MEEFKHNTDAADPFAWQPQTPARARASALLAACAVLAAQDKQLSAPETPSPRPAACPLKHQQRRQQEQMDAVMDYQQQQQSPCPTPARHSANAVPPPAQAQDTPVLDACNEQSSQAQIMDIGATNEAAAIKVELELSAELATPPGSPAATAGGASADAFMTPARQMLRGSSVEFPALDAGVSPAATPVLCTPSLTPAVKWRLPLWKKLHPLCLNLQRPDEQVRHLSQHSQKNPRKLDVV